MSNLPLRVLIVDDVHVNRRLLETLLQQSPGFEVVGWAADGVEAVRKTAAVKPDIVTMDIEVPNANGVEAIRDIMSSTPVPIVVVSSHVNNPSMNVAFEALQAGALDVVQKPDLALLAGPSAARSRLLETLRAMAGVKVIKRRARKDAPPVATPPAIGKRVADVEIVAIGTSAGGPQALATVLSALPANYPYPIVVTQHMVDGFIAGAAKWLDSRCPLNVKLATPGELLRAGTVYFAPDHSHFRIDRHPGKGLIANIGSDAPIGGFRPAVNALLNSVAETCGERAVGGILTGMGRDGDKGLLAMFRRGAITFAQDEQSSMIFGMPKAAIEAGAARHTLALNGIAAFLCNPMQGR